MVVEYNTVCIQQMRYNFWWKNMNIIPINSAFRDLNLVV